jgi:hypothetical protein
MNETKPNIPTNKGTKYLLKDILYVIIFNKEFPIDFLPKNNEPKRRISFDLFKKLF